MLNELAGEYAKEQTDEAILNMLYNWAKSSKDNSLLLVFANRSDLPEGIAADLRKNPTAAVITTRLRRKGVSEAELIEACTDKRISVQLAIAEAAGLDESAYRMLVDTAQSPKPLLALAANPGVETSVRVQAAAKCAASNRLDTLSYEKRRLLAQVNEELITLDEDAAAKIVKDCTDPDILASIASNSVVSGKLAKQIVEKALVKLERMNLASQPARSASRSYWYLPEDVKALLNIIKGPMHYSDFDPDQRARVQVIAGELDRIWHGGANRVAGGLPKPGRGEIRVERSGKNKQAESVSAFIATTTDLELRIKYAQEQPVDEDDWVRLIREGTDIMYHGHYNQVRDQVPFKEVADQPRKLAALMSRISISKADFPTGVDKVTLMRELVDMHSEDVAKDTKAYSFMISSYRTLVIHAVHLLKDPQVSGMVPTSILEVLTQRQAYQAECCFEGDAAGRIEVMKALTGILGTSQDAWEAFDKAASKMPVSLAEAAQAAKEATE